MVPQDVEWLKGVRTTVAVLNKNGGSLRVALSPRAGKNNPNDWKRDNRFKPKLRIEDAESVDVYIVPKGAGARDKSRRRASGPRRHSQG